MTGSIFLAIIPGIIMIFLGILFRYSRFTNQYLLWFSGTITMLGVTLIIAALIVDQGVKAWLV